MAHPVIMIEGRAYRWKDILEMRREQQKARRQPQQAQLFETYNDSRPVSQRHADGRYRQPLLFKD